MNLSQLFSGAFLCLGFALCSPVKAQEPTNWKSFHQTFTAPGLRYEYTHAITFANGKLTATIRRQFGPQDWVLGILTMNLSEIDIPHLEVRKGKEKYSPDFWYLYIPVKNPNHAPQRVKATPQTDLNHLIVKDETQLYNGYKTNEIWILTQMYMNFDNPNAAHQAVADIKAACK